MVKWRGSKDSFNGKEVVRWEEDVSKQANQWDIPTKILTQANPQDLVSWLLKGAVYEEELNVELQSYKKRLLFSQTCYIL
jgi:hypothetical protein